MKAAREVQVSSSQPVEGCSGRWVPERLLLPVRSRHSFV